MRRIIIVVIILLLVTVLLLLVTRQVQGATINLNDVSEDYVFGVTLNGYRYTVVMQGDVVTKIELNGSEETVFEVRTTTNEVLGFIKDYDGMSWINRMNYVLNVFGVPRIFVLGILSKGV